MTGALLHWLRIYRVLLVAASAAAAQYRIQSVLWLLFAIIRPVVFLAAWSAAAAAQGGSIGDFTIADFAAYYICLTLVIQMTGSWDVYEFEYEVRQGKLAPKLLRPLHPLHYAVVNNLVYKFVTVPMLLPVLLLVGWTYHARFETQLFHVLLFVPSVVLAAALQFLLGWCIASLAFWTTRVHAIVHFYDRMAFVFAGLIAPLSLLPGPLAAIAYVLPFGYMLSRPADLLRGGTDLPTSVATILGQIVWVAAAWLAFTLIWRAGVRQFSAMGA